MIRWCSFCQRYLGDVTPFEDFRLTHGMCKTCAGKFESGGSFGQAERLVAFYEELRAAGDSGTLPSASAVLDEGIAMGLLPIDLLMGLMQPVLYRVGERWASGDATVAREHALTSLASALIALVMHKYPESHDYRQSSNPRVLLVAADGNFHTLGVQLVELILILERVPTFAVYPGIAAEEVYPLWDKVRAPVVGFSVALPIQVRGVRVAVERFIKERVELPRFVLGGYPVRNGLHTHPELPIETMADPRALLELRAG